ncbi:MAG: hypothetical protein IJ882_08160 [Paludibacteraceae bacterium]|nr:hypothetical protein [Paludibacteraceae bacterium]MBR3647640.1 hypothetical protein [Paludibacteraceae bacterium]
MSIVSEICEISEEEILSHTKRADVVDARNILVYYCCKYGFPAASIAKFINRKRLSSVRDMLANYKIFSAQSAAFRLLSAEVCKKLADTFPTTQR